MSMASDEVIDTLSMWEPADTAPVDREILLCHDNGEAGIFFGTGFRSVDGRWFESDAKTEMKLAPTHWCLRPRMPSEPKAA
jgi:hypothetical protein